MRIIFALILAFAASSAQGQATPDDPAFRPTDCNLPGVSAGTAPRLQCGAVRVPRRHGEPGRGHFDLAVVVVRSEQQPALPDPVLYISGGPGAPLTIYADHQARYPYAADRDLILVDQRGMGRSEPALCPRAEPALLRVTLAMAVDPTGPARQGRLAAYAACREEAIAQGLSLEDFGTAVTVEDLDQVRRALGVARWNVVGNSYGTTVAMTLMARHPETVRSAVLDSVYPPDPLPRFSDRVAAARQAFFESCPPRAYYRPDCSGLGAQYAAAVARLARAPLTVAIPPQLGWPGGIARLTPSLFIHVVGNLLYYPNTQAALRGIITGVGAGNTTGFASALAAILTGAQTGSLPAAVAVECRDRPDFQAPLPDSDAFLDLTRLFGLCAAWSPPGPAPIVPDGTAIPTLVLAGEFDPVASPALSRAIAAQLGPRARWVEFARMGHHVRAFSACAGALVAGFIDRPETVQDIACAQQLPADRSEPQ